MKKRFNDTGVCVPGKHYMVDAPDKISRIFSMVEQGDYFVINSPRQYGKTTTLYLLDKTLKNKNGYFPVKMSFEGIGADSFKNEAAFIEAFILRLERVFALSGNSELLDFTNAAPGLTTLNKLDAWFSQLVTKIGGKVVLMIDEVDKSSNNQLFLDFLGVLREKYLQSRVDEDTTFHSVILAGVHDVKSLKIKIRPGSEAKYNSPWNIAADFNVDLSLTPDEIASMLTEYSNENQVTMDVPFFSNQLFYITSGYPFLVSYLCKTIDEIILPEKNKKEWLPKDLTGALKITFSKNNTNFESLVKNLEDNPELYDLVFQIIMNEKEFSYNPRNPLIHLGTVYGILKEQGNGTVIHNRLYEQLVYDYMSSKLETSGALKSTGMPVIAGSYMLEDGSLDIRKIIVKFQEFMKEQYSSKDREFIERNGRLLFLAFIKPIINGRGFDFKEPQVSEEKRLDVVITFMDKKYIVELKIWRGPSYHREGIKQLCDYLDRQNETNGYLLIYDLRKEHADPGKWETIKEGNKTIAAAWV